MANQNQNKCFEEAIKENPKLFGSLFLVILGLMIGYYLEANDMIETPLMIIPVILVIPASFMIFKMAFFKGKK